MKELIKQARGRADKQLDCKKIVGGITGVVLEVFDGPLIEAGLEFAYERLPESTHDEFEIALQAYVSGDYRSITTDVAGRLADAINIPGINEAQENILFKHVYLAFVEILECSDGPEVVKSSEPGQGPDEPRGED